MEAGGIKQEKRNRESGILSCDKKIFLDHFFRFLVVRRVFSAFLVHFLQILGVTKRRQNENRRKKKSVVPPLIQKKDPGKNCRHVYTLRFVGEGSKGHGLHFYNNAILYFTRFQSPKKSVFVDPRSKLTERFPIHR